ncbi:MAG: AAC(3) family N-acetyltransferase, partial [Lentisphaerae bacterium]|nr:AAC(3) family N-acetyltransferase [Lentisphaerota bacterium]
VLLDAVRLADRHVGGVHWQQGENFISDTLPPALMHGGHVSLEQETGPTYHSSADTPGQLRLDALKWAGTAATAYLAMMTHYDNTDLLRLARRIRRDSERKAPERNRDARRRQRARLDRELASLLDGAAGTDLYPDFTTPAEFYAAGVNRRTGLWPVIKTAEALKSELNGCLPSRNGYDAAAANDLVPRAAFKGYPAFESLLSARGQHELTDRTGLAPGWGTPPWAWMLTARCSGKRPLPEILGELREMGVAIDPARAEAFVRYLADHEKMPLRPVLGADRLRKELRACGIRRGGVLMAHVSLSQFGYVVGGAKTVVDVLLDLVGPKGTLVLPTHSNSVLGTPPYDPKRSPASTGTIPDYFRRQAGVVRSPHPTHSVAACGPAARELCEAHAPTLAPLSREGFWGTFYEMNGDVLLMCPITSATIFHVGETWLGLPQKPLVAHWMEGERRRVATLSNGPWHVDHFEQTMARPLLRRGVMHRVPLGESEVYVGPARAMCDTSVRVIKRDPMVIVPKDGTCACGYCRTLRAGLEAGLPADGNPAT